MLIVVDLMKLYRANKFNFAVGGGGKGIHISHDAEMTLYNEYCFKSRS